MLLNRLAENISFAFVHDRLLRPVANVKKNFFST